MTIQPKYQIDTKENKQFLETARRELLSFGHHFPSPEGSSYYLGDDGTPWKDRNRETWITSRMTHVYSIGSMLGHEGSEALADAALKGLRGELHDDQNGGWYAGLTKDNEIVPTKQCYAHAFVILSASSAMLAKIDGADKWQQLRYVTLPLLISSITISLVFNIISGFKVFAQVYSTTNGGPADSTHVLGTFLFKSFGNGFLGYSAAVGLFTTVLIVALSMTLLAILRKREVEY